VFSAYFPVSHPERPTPAPVAVTSVAAPPPALRRSLPQHAPRIDPVNWPTIAERARHESLRDLACAYGVSHETIRAIVRRVDAAMCTTITMTAD
jgi:cytochrome oxidase assembly protein ShyY1